MLPGTRDTPDNRDIQGMVNLDTVVFQDQVVQEVLAIADFLE